MSCFFVSMFMYQLLISSVCRVKFQPWHALTNINFSHNSITTFDSSMTLLPALKYVRSLFDSTANDLLKDIFQYIYLKKTLKVMVSIFLQLDLSNNKISHFDLEQLTCSCLHTLSLASNSIYLISGTTKVGWFRAISLL